MSTGGNTTAHTGTSAVSVVNSMPSLRRSCRTSPMSLIPVDLIHSHATMAAVYVGGSMFSRERHDTSESRVREPRLPGKACHRAQRAGSAATHLYAWKGVYVYLVSTSCFLESSPLTLAPFNKLLPDFDELRRLEPRHQGPPRHCPAVESPFIVQHRDHKLTVEPRLVAAGGRLRLVRKSVERHRFTVSA
jgi:hypothetical protein